MKTPAAPMPLKRLRRLLYGLKSTLLWHRLRVLPGLGTGLQSPIENTLFPDVYIPDDQRADKYQDLYQCNCSEGHSAYLFLREKIFKRNRERDHEKYFDIEKQ